MSLYFPKSKLVFVSSMSEVFRERTTDFRFPSSTCVAVKRSPLCLYAMGFMRAAFFLLN